VSAGSIPANGRSGGALARLAPRTRLVAALLLVLAIAMLREPAVAAVAVLAGLALVGLAGIPPRPLLRRLLQLEGFLVVLLLMLPFTIPGVPLLAIGPVAVSAEGLARAIRQP
jgi:cobalt/nickel transport system permease protein